jgi:hypothetical protein
MVISSVPMTEGKDISALTVAAADILDAINLEEDRKESGLDDEDESVNDGREDDENSEDGRGNEDDNNHDMEMDDEGDLCAAHKCTVSARTAKRIALVPSTTSEGAALGEAVL